MLRAVDRHLRPAHRYAASRTWLVWVLSPLPLAAVGLVVRSYGVDALTMSSDEAFSWRVTQCAVTDMVNRVAKDVHPPGYFLLLKAWMTIFGTSLFVMRSLSVVLGTGAVVMAYAATGKALRTLSTDASCTATESQAIYGALLAGAVVVLHPLQLDAGRIARMYSCGVLFTGITSWLLLHALDRHSRSGLRWTLYGGATAMFLYVHYFAMFTVIAQGLFTICYSGAPRARALQPQRQPAWSVAPFLRAHKGSLLALCFGALCWVPWLPVFVAQAQDVQRSFWIPPMTISSLCDALVFCAVGTRNVDTSVAFTVILGVLAAAAWACIYRVWAAIFFFVQWCIPLACVMFVWIAGDRPLLESRYLCFAQFAVVGFWGTVFASIKPLSARVIIGGSLVGTVAYSAVAYAHSLPHGASVMERTVEFVSQHGSAGDVIVVQRPSHVNIFRYYLSRHGPRPIEVRCERTWHRQQGHVTHIASLDADDVLLPTWIPPPHVARVWSIGGAGDVYVSEWHANTEAVFIEPTGLRAHRYGPTVMTARLLRRPTRRMRGTVELRSTPVSRSTH